MNAVRELRCPACQFYLTWTMQLGVNGWYCPGCWKRHEVTEIDGRYVIREEPAVAICVANDGIAVPGPSSFEAEAVAIRTEVKSAFEESQVNHPEHYGGADSPYEAIKVIEAWNLDKSFCLGNAVKYLCRAGLKPGASLVEDLRKARWYLDREISRLERSS